MILPVIGGNPIVLARDDNEATSAKVAEGKTGASPHPRTPAEFLSTGPACSRRTKRRKCGRLWKEIMNSIRPEF